jgi:signal transduction histidine kinase/ActR/RegA family two-component response regulator
MTSLRADRTFPTLPVGLAVLVLAVLSSIWLAQRERAAVGLVDHTLRIQHQLTSVLTQMQGAETGERGYLLTGRAEFLEPYDRAMANLAGDLDDLGKLVADNPKQRASLVILRQLSIQHEDGLRRSLTLYRQGDRLGATAPVLLDRSRRLMDEVRARIVTMDADEARALLTRSEAVRRQSVVVGIVLVLSALVTLSLSVVVFFDARRRLKALIIARDHLAVSNEHLQSELLSREAAETQVRQMQKMEAIGQLTGGIAHDFNNMLAIIIGSLDMAKRRRPYDAARADEYVDNAIEAGQRAAQLTARLLAFSRQQPLAPETLDVNKLVAGMSELLRRTIGENLRVETVLAGGLWRAYADTSQLENAILNLCVNARDAMPAGGRLTIETSNAHLDEAYAQDNIDVEAGQFTMVSVSDTGEGMAASVVDRAFDPFYTTKGVGKGTGLGLSQVHGFVRQSGGHVKIYSELGVGTTVKIYLPRSFAAQEAAEVRSRPPVEPPRANGEEIILVVEDEERVRQLSVETLRELGYTVVQASDGAQALAVLTVQPRIDLLFTDIVMPDMNGRRLADEARKMRPGLKVLYTTGYTRDAIVHNGVLDPNVTFVPKPFTIGQLAVKVRKMLDSGGARTPDTDGSTRPLPRAA